MKIELFALNGSFAHSNLAVRCLRTALFEAGFSKVGVTEATLRDRTATTLARLVAADATLYGFSCYIWNIREMLALAADLKAVLPSCHIVLGGPEVSYDTERFGALDFVDAVITGEGEGAIVTAAKVLENGGTLPRVLAGKPDEDFEKRGIHYRAGEPISSLVYYESSRGCPFSCAFCLSSASHGVRAKSAERALADLAAFEALEGQFTVKLVDRTFNFDRERAKAIWRGLLDKAYTKCYHFEVCAALLDEESFEILAALPKGKVQLEIGLQSTNHDTLEAIGRRDDAAKVIAAARRIRAVGNIHVHLDLIAGLPHEDMASFAASFDAAYPAADLLQVGFLKLLHGTALRRDAARYGIICSAEPPYTVLKTASLSFADLCRLRRLADVVERLCERGRFQSSLDLLLSRTPSPFAFFDGFGAYVAREDGRELQRIPQRELFSHVAAYGKQLLAPEDGAAFVRLLEADFARFEVRRPPKF